MEHGQQMVPKATFDALQEQLSTLQATVDRLTALLEEKEQIIEISNNQVENAIRPIVVGRKNWLFCDTQAGANASVLIFTLLETAKANGLNPEAYLNHLLTVLPERLTAKEKAERAALIALFGGEEESR